MREVTQAKRLADKQEAELRLKKKEEKIAKAAIRHEEEIKENILDKIRLKKDKWAQRVELKKTLVKQEENTSYKKGAEHTKAIKNYLEEKRHKDRMFETFRSSP